jgi:hypothetical protein
MKEYNIKLNLVIEAQDSDYDRVVEYAQEVADALLQDDNITYDEDIEVIEISVDDIHNLSGYQDEDFEETDEDEDEDEYY